MYCRYGCMLSCRKTQIAANPEEIIIESKEDVALSKTKILGYFNNALAIENRCFSPPET